MPSVAAHQPAPEPGWASFNEAAFDLQTGAYKNEGDTLWREIGQIVLPSDPPPQKKS